VNIPISPPDNNNNKKVTKTSVKSKGTTQCTFSFEGDEMVFRAKNVGGWDGEVEAAVGLPSRDPNVLQHHLHQQLRKEREREREDAEV
jgi:hypothetical protein